MQDASKWRVQFIWGWEIQTSEKKYDYNWTAGAKQKLANWKSEWTVFQQLQKYVQAHPKIWTRLFLSFFLKSSWLDKFLSPVNDR